MTQNKILYSNRLLNITDDKQRTILSKIISIVSRVNQWLKDDSYLLTYFELFLLK